MPTKKIICHDIQNNQVEIEAEKLIYRPSVYGILIENDQVLLSKQWDGYDLPGGGMNIDETIEETLKREFFEETGLKIKPIMPIHCETSFFWPSHSEKYKNQYWNCPMIYFLVKKIGGNISKENFDEEEKSYADLPEWISLQAIINLKFCNSVDGAALIKKSAELMTKINPL
jgi:8-oxo-dGTP pyrophosphatase MutT (NUDIX family)